MLKVGLTGGIAAGKSIVGDMFVALGARLVQADRIAHSLMQPGEAVYNEVVRHFGREILIPTAASTVPSWPRSHIAPATDVTTEGTEDIEKRKTKTTGKRASRIEELNRIVDPVVIRNQDAWMQEMAVRILMPSPSSKQRSYSKRACTSASTAWSS